MLLCERGADISVTPPVEEATGRGSPLPGGALESAALGAPATVPASEMESAAERGGVQGPKEWGLAG